MNREYLIERLYEIGSIKLGEFSLKSGLKSPIYFDMRLLISHPKLLVNRF
jgi:uridine monophosphate synthetase